MSQLSREVAGWLQSCPGGIRGDTEDEVWAEAYEKFCFDRRIKDLTLAPIGTFMQHVNTLGYHIETRRDHSTGGSYPMLALPQAHVGF